MDIGSPWVEGIGPLRVFFFLNVENSHLIDGTIERVNVQRVKLRFIGIKSNAGKKNWSVESYHAVDLYHQVVYGYFCEKLLKW